MPPRDARCQHPLTCTTLCRRRGGRAAGIVAARGRHDFMGSPSARAWASWPRASSAGRWRAARRRIEDFAVVLDLTIGGTILATGALVGRARAAEARREAQLGVLQHAARRMSASLSPRGGRPRRRRGDATRHRLPQRPRLPARPARRPRADRVRGPRRRLREGRHGDPADEDRRGVHGLGRAPRPGAARRRRDLRPARRDHPRHGRRRRVDAGRPDAARREADRRDHAVQARAAPVRRRGPAAADDPRRPGGHRVQRAPRTSRRRDGSPPSCGSSWT